MSIHEIEAGGMDVNRASMLEPGSWRANLGTDVDWQYRTVPQPNANERTLDYARGKVIGGSSTINGMAWVWGHPTDFDSWGNEGDEGWDDGRGWRAPIQCGLLDGAA
jgi:choline dehydrogenase